ARRKVVMPGMVDLHATSGGGLVKTVGENLDAAEWRNMFQLIIQNFTDPEWWRVESQLHALERLKFGTTAIYTTNGGSGTRNDDPRYIETSLAAFEEIGIRATFGLGPPRPPWPQPFVDWENGRPRRKMVAFEQVIEVCDDVLRQAKERPRELISFITALSRLGNRNRQDPVWSAEHEAWVFRQAEAMRGLMEKYDLGFWTNIYGEAVEFAVDNDLGLLGPKTILSHASDVTERGINLIAERGCHIAYSPRARRVYSFPGRCPVVEYVDHGVNVALGSDGPPPDRVSDMFLDMKMTMTLQRLHFRDPHVIPPGLALEMATINGYRALGLDHLGGSIEVGKRADLVVVDFFKPHLVPVHMPVHQLVYEASGHDVETVMVNGKILIEDRQVKCVDEAALLEQAQELSEKTVRDAGLGPLTVRPDGFWGKSRY
ncbi:MAG: amidohydrolase family protein, partial [Chloroflexi bacterium]|nr:amidohydrolase family protein [Chloroflexota bacterium]